MCIDDQETFEIIGLILVFDRPQLDTSAPEHSETFSYKLYAKLRLNNPVHRKAAEPVESWRCFRAQKSEVPCSRRSAAIPSGSWPRRMPADLAAGYCGETTVEGFLKRVGKEYPRPQIKEGRRQLWLIDDLDRAIAPRQHCPRDAAGDY